VRQGLTGASAVERLQQLIDEMQQRLEEIEAIHFEAGPGRQRDLATRLGRVQGILVAAESAGVSPDLVAAWAVELDGLRTSLVEGRFEEVADGSDRLRVVATESIDQVRSEHELQLQRQAVLAALRDSCRHLGYRELNPAELERDLENATSEWTLLVDTRTKGRISFTIGAGTITAETSMGVQGDRVNGDYCFAEFARIEEQLSRSYGLQTHFESGTIQRPDPTSGRKGARRPGASTSRSEFSGGSS